MKWVLVKKGSEIVSPEFMKAEKSSKKALKLDLKSEQKSFVTINDSKALSSLSIKWNRWVSYKLSSPMDQKGRSRYEIFCGGWAAYHDQIIEKGPKEHFIYFKWETNKVTIYISPPHKDTKTKKPVTPIWDIQKLISSQISPGKDPPPPPAPPPPPM
jgi:hypothetical protein